VDLGDTTAEGMSTWFGHRTEVDLNRDVVTSTPQPAFFSSIVPASSR
jgi:hypothetical protein